MKFKLFFIVALALACSGVVSAQIIFTNPITGTNPNTANPYTTGQTVDANLTVSGIGRGTGITGVNTNDRYNASGWNTSALDANDYFEFTLTPNSGYMVSFVSLLYTSQASGTGPTSFAVRSSVDGYAANIATPASTGATISLAAAAYQYRTTATTFRIYGWGASAVGGTFSINDFTFNGTVEPAGFLTAQNGPWTTPATWVGGVVPTSADNAIVRHLVTDATGITRNAATTTTINTGAALNVSNGYVNNGTTTVDGSFSTASGLTINAGSTFRVNGGFSIAAGGFVTGGSPIYGSASTLSYQTGGLYGRGLEWNALGVGTIGTTPGYPNNVTLSSGTILNYNNGTPQAKAMAGNLSINSGTSFYMDYGGGASGGALTVAGNVTISGNFTLGNAIGDDLRVAGNFSYLSGTFNGNNRAVIFTKASGTQTVNAASAISIPYFVFDATGSRTVQLLSNNITITAPATGNAVSFGSAADVLDLNSFSLTIGTAGIANSIFGAGTFRGSPTSNLTLLGTGTIGTLNFTTGFQNLGTLTIDRTSAALGATLGTPLTINTSLALTNGRLDVGNNPITIGSGATISGAGTNNYVIVDVANGTGAAMRKVLAVGPVVNFDFPIGDGAASANGSQYSPTRIVDLSGATYSAGAYVSAAVNDIKHPSFDATTDYITRYWDIQTSGVTSPSVFTMSATYQDSDIVGTETLFRANRWNGTAWSNTGSAVGATTNLVTDMSGFVAGGINHFTAGRRDQEINVIQTATTTTYLHNSTFNFGSVLVGSNLDIQFTVQNTGQIDLALPGTNTIVGGPSYAFAPAGTLATGPLTGPTGTRNFTIRFAPTGAGTFTGSITIPNNDPTGAEAPYVINFTGVGIVPAPEINIKGFTGSTNNIVSGSTTASGLNNTLFAATTIGSSATKDYEIQNLGTAVLNLTGAPLVSIGGVNPGDFAVTTVPGTNAIAASASTTFIITFTPTASGVRTAVVSIANNDSDENPYTFLIQGTGNCATITNTVTPTSGPQGTVVTTTSSGSLAGATVTFAGVSAVVTPISTNQVTVVVPAGATTGNLVTTNAQGCSGNNYFTVIDNLITSCQGGSALTELFISEVTDSNNGGLSYVEIYNGTAAPVFLPNYGLRVANNGGGYSFTTGLTGAGLPGANLPVGSSYIVALGNDSSCSIPGGNGSYANQTTVSGGINFNANEHDHIALFRLAVQVDSWGVFGATSWAPLSIGTNGATFRRKKTAPILPNVTYSNADWNIVDYPGTTCTDNDYTDIGTFDFSRGTPPAITVQPAYSPSCKAVTFTVAATEGFSGGLPLAYQWYVTNPGNANWSVVIDNATFSGATTATLNITNIAGLDGYQFYCQVRENGATCYTASNAVMILGSGTVTWNGTAWTPSAPTVSTPAVIDGDYNTTTNGDFEACSLTVLGTRTLTVSANHYISIVNDLTVNANGTLNVLNNGSLVMVDDAGIVTNNGTMQVSRTTQPFVKYDYTYWSSPIASATIGTTFPGWRMDYSWIFQTANYSDVTGPNGTGPADGFDDNLDTWIHTTPATVMTPANGYVIMGPTNLPSYPATSTVTFSGRVNNGIVTIPLAMSANAAATDDDFNIIGNPYPSSVFADDFINLNTNTSGTVKFWTHQAPVSNTAPGPYQSNFVTSDYAMYNLSGGTASGTGSTIPTGMIATGQGFLVEALAGTNVIFNNSMRDKSQINTNFYRQSQNTALAAQKDRVWVNFKHSIGLFSQQLVAYIEGATLDYDRGYDGKASKSGNAVSFYSFIETEKYRIQGRPSFTTSDIVPMGYSTTLPGTYTITIDHAEGQLNESSQPIYIEDKLLNIIHDLKESDYVFTTELGTFNDRFQLRYTTESLGTPDVGSLDQVGILSSNQMIRVKSRTDIKSIEVIDMLGRSIFKKTDINAVEFDTRLEIAKQALLVKVILTNGSSVTKKIIH
ncbi:MAG: choice-of-anchor D domain-containing protein [Flavobacterium sp.]|uniref:choice-of-anchor D domain-containing protein n=1 Tax=Flavobacterium sp. TaxID=239 RepID=UPI0012290C9E|nr:choice-of-anchor D domain-containing protein [Flavobacterium sp.]RZJ68549.1 MAG: choice-of-anchor D domain-containing protein [Flavobacterium sp.]